MHMQIVKDIKKCCIHHIN